MDKPYRFRKRLVKIGGSSYVHIPAYWIAEQERKLKIKKLMAVDMEIHDGKLVLTPERD